MQERLGQTVACQGTCKAWYEKYASRELVLLSGTLDTAHVASDTWLPMLMTRLNSYGEQCRILLCAEALNGMSPA
jgi:hypothetical protein